MIAFFDSNIHIRLLLGSLSLDRVLEEREEIGLARLQNDILLALTSRYTGALFLTSDAHFDTIRRHVPSRIRTLEN